MYAIRSYYDGRLAVKGKAVAVHYDFINQKSVPIPDSIKEKLKEHFIEGID